MNQVQASRLLTLAHFLKTEVNEEEFDMHTWGTKHFVCEGDGAVDADVFSGPLGETPSKCQVATKKITCDTSACALGWATAVFPEKLRLSFDGWSLQQAVDYATDYVGEHQYVHANVEIKIGNEWRRWTSDTVADFFGLETGEYDDEGNLSVSEIDLLFGGDDMTAKQKAKQIEKLVDSKGWTYEK